MLSGNPYQISRRFYPISFIPSKLPIASGVQQLARARLQRESQGIKQEWSGGVPQHGRTPLWAKTQKHPPPKPRGAEVTAWPLVVALWEVTQFGLYWLEK